MIEVEAHGARIPALGLGTWQLSGALARRMVGYALEIGYRHVDTAQMYGNETEVGAAIAGSGVPREQLSLTTKIWPDHFRAAALKRAAEESVRRLGTEPDLLLLHWPSPSVPLAETIPALNEVKQRGLARHIGISNFNVALIREAVARSRGAARGQSGRVPALSEPGRGARGGARSRHGADRRTRRSPKAWCSRTGHWRRSASATARARARWRCAGWSSRTASPRSRARAARRASAQISRSSTSSSRRRRWRRSSRSRARAVARSTSLASPRAGIEANLTKLLKSGSAGALVPPPSGSIYWRPGAAGSLSPDGRIGRGGRGERGARRRADRGPRRSPR